MKRTLLEIACGLAVLVVLASFQHQVARLRVQNQEVEDLRKLVEATASKATSKDDIVRLREMVLRQLDDRLANLEARLATAAAGSEEAHKLRRELEHAKTDMVHLQARLGRDVSQTKDLVDAYVHEMRAKEQDASMRMTQARQAIADLAETLLSDTERLTHSMLAPTVQLNGEDTVGSGTLIFSDRVRKTGKVESYVLTSHHVVRNILADTPRARREGFDVTLYLTGGKVNVKGRMIAHNTRIDAALVKLETDRRFPHVANVLPRDPRHGVQIFDPVYAVGCPLGNDPVPSQGQVSSLSNELNSANYWMINAPTYFGNSGGGVYLGSTRQLIGVFSKIYTHGKGTPVVVPHMGLCTPIETIYQWLEDEGMDHILRGAEIPVPDLHALAAPIK